jgi:hypothetical protein
MQRTERLGIVLSEREKAAVVRLAEVEGGLSQAALVRRLIRQAARSRGLWQPVNDGMAPCTLNGGAAR